VHPFTAIDHVQPAMPAGREDDARAFFCGGCWFSSGEVQVHLGVEPEFRPARKAHPGLRCANLRALLQRLREAGIAYEEDGAMGSPRAFVHDPFGNRLELIG
jgi:catechol 2,3-dioxygenase-like lactoylglutathione lyase family enzyme